MTPKEESPEPGAALRLGLPLALLERLLGCQRLEVQLRREWGASAATDHRLAIRRGLALHLGVVNETPPHWLDELQLLPESPDFSISISHGTDIGGFALCAGGPSGLGFDLESLGRLSASIIARMSTPEERSAAPDPRFLWVAKEAVYKSLRGPAQPKVITDLEILDWEEAPATEVSPHQTFRVYSFRARTALSDSVSSNLNLGPSFGRGAIVQNMDGTNGEVFAFFLRNGPLRLT